MPLNMDKYLIVRLMHWLLWVSYGRCQWWTPWYLYTFTFDFFMCWCYKFLSWGHCIIATATDLLLLYMDMWYYYYYYNRFMALWILSGITQISRYQKSKTTLDLLEQEIVSGSGVLGHMQICTSPQTDNDASITPLSFLQTGCPSCCPTNSINALHMW